MNLIGPATGIGATAQLNLQQARIDQLWAQVGASLDKGRSDKLSLQYQQTKPSEDDDGSSNT